MKAAEDALTRNMTRAERENATVYLQVWRTFIPEFWHGA